MAVAPVRPCDHIHDRAGGFISEPKQGIISENTLWTTGMVIIVLGFAAWLTAIWFQGNASAKAIDALQNKQDAVQLIQTDIAVIKVQLQDLNSRFETYGPNFKKR